MISQLQDKKAIFFDVGYTLDAPASGDWMKTGKFHELAGARLKQRRRREKRIRRKPAGGKNDGAERRAPEDH